MRWLLRQRWGGTPHHEAEFVNPTIHFTITTNVSSTVNLESASRKLLQEGLAWSSAWPSEVGVRLGRTLGELDRDVDRFDRFIASIKAADSRWDWWLLRLRYRRELRGIASAPSASEPAGSDDAPDEIDDDPLQFARDVLIDHQKVSTAERVVDRQLFGGVAQDEDHYVRLILANSYHDLNDQRGNAESRRMVFEPRLMLHQSGLIQLTIAVHLKGTFKTREVVHYSHATAEIILHSDLPAPLVSHLPARDVAGSWMDVIDVGNRMRSITFTDGASMSDVLDLHIGAVRSIAKLGMTGPWLIHPTTVAHAGRCCTDQEAWTLRHASDVAQISARHSKPMKVPTGWGASTDLSIDPQTSTYVNLGSSTHVVRSGPELEAAEQLFTVMLIEYGLTLYWRLRMLEARGAQFNLRERDLKSLYIDSIQMLSELRHNNVSYGSARDITRQLVRDLGGDAIQQTLTTTLDLSAQTFAASSASRAAYRQVVLAVIGSLVAAVVAIPTVTDLLSGVRDSPPTGLLSPVGWAAEAGARGAWILTATVIFVVGAIATTIPLVRAATRRFQVPRRMRRRGWRSTLGELPITFGPVDEAP